MSLIHRLACRWRVGAGAAACLLALAGCDGRRQDAVQAPVPLSAPDIATMGAGPAPGAPASCRLLKLPEDMLARINAARAAGQRCGSRSMGPAGPLKWDPQLSAAAAAHSRDMAQRNYFDHASPEGSQVQERTAQNGYKWRSVGENIAAGDTSVDAVVQSWLRSPDHCENIMEPRFADIAVACVQQPGSQWGTYWTMVLGRK